MLINWGKYFKDSISPHHKLLNIPPLNFHLIIKRPALFICLYENPVASLFLFPNLNINYRLFFVLIC